MPSRRFPRSWSEVQEGHVITAQSADMGLVRLIVRTVKVMETDPQFARVSGERISARTQPRHSRLKAHNCAPMIELGAVSVWRRSMTEAKRHG